MSRVFVTGATGFIGGHLVSALVEAGHEVTCLVRKTSNRSGLEPLGVDFHVGDINSVDSLAEPIADVDMVFHLAAMLKAPWRSDFLSTNADGARNVAAACARAKQPPTLVAVSSLAAAGPSEHGRPRNEAVAPKPVSKYGRSKLNGEIAVREFAGEVPSTIIRPPMVFGGGDKASLPLFQVVAKGWHLTPTLSSNRVAMIHVTDLARAMVRAAERGERLPASGSGSPGTGIYFVAHNQQPTMLELGHLIAGAMGQPKLRVVRTPSIVTKLVGGVGEVFGRITDKPSMFNYDKTREATAGSWLCSTAKAREQLQFKPGALLEDRLRETAGWYRDNGWL